MAKIEYHTLEFDLVYTIAGEAIATNHFRKKLMGILKSEAYASSYVWNELDRLPHKGFLLPFLKGMGLDVGNSIRSIKSAPPLKIIDHKARPDIVIETDKSIVLFEMKNLYKKGSINQFQVTRYFLAALNLNKPPYLIVVGNEKNKDEDLKKNRNLIYEEIKRDAPQYLKKEKKLTGLFHKYLKRDRIIYLNWRKFLEHIHKQIGSSKKQAKNNDLQELYTRVHKRINEFIKMRKQIKNKEKI